MRSYRFLWLTPNRKPAFTRYFHTLTIFKFVNQYYFWISETIGINYVLAVALNFIFGKVIKVFFY